MEFWQRVETLFQAALEKEPAERAGFLDGSAGLFLAYHIANGSFLKYRLLAKHPRRRDADRAGESIVELGSRVSR